MKASETLHEACETLHAGRGHTANYPLVVLAHYTLCGKWETKPFCDTSRWLSDCKN
jgi:CDGSH-type Zn-finger protein